VASRAAASPGSSQQRLARGRRALLGEEQAVGGVLERLGALEPVDAVVGERALEVRHVALRQTLGGGVERAQERVQVLLRAAELVLVLETAGVRPVERPHVRVQLEQAALGGEIVGCGGQHALHLVGREVEAEDEPLEAREVGRPVAVALLGRLEAHAIALGPARRVLLRVDLQQRLAGGDVRVGGDEHLADAAVDGRGQRALHLHALGDRHDVAWLHLVAGGDGDRDHDARAVAADQAALVARDAVGDAVDLDEQVGVLQRRHRPVGAPVVGEPALVLGERLDGRLDAGVVDLDEVAPGRGLADAEAVARAAVQEVDGAAHVGLGVRAPAAGERVEAGPLGGGGGVAERDRRLHKRGVGVAHGLHVARGLQAVQPARVDLAGAQLRAAQELQQEALVGRALVDRDHRVRDGAAQPCDRLRPGVAVGDDLGHHRVELRRHGVALGHAAVDAHAGPGGQPQQRDAAGRGGEPAARVLGVQAHLDGVAARRRRIALEPPALRDVELEADEVGAGHHLRDGVLDLQPRVDLHEGEVPALGLVEELDGPGAAVAGLTCESDGGVGELALLLGGERRAGGLLEHLLVAALVAAVAHAERPHAAVPVGHQLHLDVAGGADEALHQHARVAERLLRLGAGALEGGLELVGGVDAAHAPPAAAGRGLDHEREAELLAVAHGLLDALDRPAAPGRHRHARLLGEPLALDLVAERAHDVRVGADEDDPEALAQLGERRVLGHEAPPDPGRVGARLDERALEALVVEIGAQRLAVGILAGGGTEAVVLVGLAHEQRVALGLGEQRDHRDRVVALLVELADGVDGAHRRLAAVDDGEPPDGDSGTHALLCVTGITPGFKGPGGRAPRSGPPPPTKWRGQPPSTRGSGRSRLLSWGE
jgi:hypothetical protein